MSVVVVGAAVVTIGATVGGMYMGGKGAQTEEEKWDLKSASTDLYREQTGLLGDIRTQDVLGTTQQAELGFANAQSQFTGGQRDVTMGTQAGIRNIQTSTATATSRSGLATSGAIKQQTQTQTGDVMAKYKSDMTKLFETRELAGQQRDLTIETAKADADLAYRRGEMSAEEAHEARKTEIESQPTGFLEGMFS